MEINFHEQKSLKVIFDGDKTAEEIYKRLTANIPGVKLIPGKTLIFLDKIQKCSNARTALKFLAEDGRYDVIASGSLTHFFARIFCHLLQILPRKINKQGRFMI